MASAFPTITVETAKAILVDILTALNTPKNLEKLAEANEKSGNEMLKKMQFVFPLVMEIQIEVIKNYGFPEGREGVVRFAEIIRTFEREDPEVVQLRNQVRSYFLPPILINSTNEALP
ncbi:protein C10 isoform X1 [Harpegnathos saltator]|uniref:Protein C10 n=1 Tax=Harpegnathos saltator TaxID=610380 RepID=E2BFV6_HARSA|nr:protein C10 isoform X1 [Harpegnathos saltator]EFN85358.1 Protein C10 [Harpegnathos saltator]